MFDRPEMERRARTVHDAGGLAFPTVMYGLSPVHTDDWFADKVRQMASWGFAAGIEVEDAAGILTPRTRPHPAARARGGGGRRARRTPLPQHHGPRPDQ